MTEIFEIKVYKNDDYTARRVEYVDETVRYFVKYSSATTATEEYDFSESDFEKYYGESKREFQAQIRADKRHKSDKTLYNFEQIVRKFPYVPDFTGRVDMKISIESIVKTCTQKQQERFSLYFDNGYSLEKIAEMQGVSITSVWESLEAVLIKIKKFL